jgi:capsular polysaccharide transport system ATP-binding protein
MIRLSNVTKLSDAGKFILRDISVDLGEEGTIGILGPRASGKTTLLGLLMRTVRPDAGRVQTDSSVSWPIGSRQVLSPRLSLRENIRATAMLYGMDPPALVERVRAFADPGRYMDRKMRDAPRDVQLAFTYGLCFAFGFDYYLIDEALQTSSPELSEKIGATINYLRRESTFIIATRHPRFIREYCDLVYVLNNGSLERYDNINDAIRVFKGL